MVLLRRVLLFAGAAAVLAALCHFAARSAVTAAARATLDACNADQAAGLRASLDAALRDRLRQAAEHARDIAAHYAGEVREGRLADAAARAAVRDALQSLMIGPHGGVLARDVTQALVVPPRPGSLLAQAITRATFRPTPLSGGLEGYAEEVWRSPGDEQTRTAGFHVLAFEAWGWQIVAGCYRDEVWAETPSEDFERFLAPGRGAGGGDAFLLQRDKSVLLAPSLSGEKTASLAPLVENLLSSPAGSYSAASYRYRDEAGGVEGRRWLAVAPVADTSWVVVTTAWAGPAPRLGVLLATFTWLLTLAVALLTAAALAWVWWTARESLRATAHVEDLVTERAAEATRGIAAENNALELHLADCRRNETRLEKGNRDLSAWVDDLKQTSYEIALLNQMSDLLQACRSVRETDGIIVQIARELFPSDSGVLCRFNPSQNLLETVTSWGHPLTRENGEFAVEDCWALRRGKTYSVEDPESDLICQHLPSAPGAGYTCIPMMAQGELLGMLHLQWGPPDPSLSEEARSSRQVSKKQLATTVTEQFALAVANLKLREALRIQSIRDPLTGLYNRRHMEESLAREIHRAKRHQKPLGIIMLDVDHFKRFNDTYGHEEGDVLLRELGTILQAGIRQEDIACRYGGEEFLVMLPDAPLRNAVERAEMLRRQIRTGLKIKQEPVTVSIGVAVYPDHGLTGETVVGAADRALYQAKHAGRDRVVVSAVGE